VVSFFETQCISVTSSLSLPSSEILCISSSVSCQPVRNDQTFGIVDWHVNFAVNSSLSNVRQISNLNPLWRGSVTVERRTCDQ